ncbi:MAG: metallophosphoesterase [Planctomycetes bacterium]|nr:metallophosphoesterase [Planctomycetota bacterium]
MTLLVLGDCHASWSMLIDAIDVAVARHGVTAVIQVGDFGFFPLYFPLLEKMLINRPFRVPVHVIEGNHEDHAWLWAQAADGAFNRWAKEFNLIVHRRGDVASVAGITVGFLGGALHADRSQHGSTAKGTTNWVTNREADRAALAFNATSIDLMVTHSCPHSIGVGIHGSAELFLAVERYIQAKGFDGGPYDDCGEPALVRLWKKLERSPKSWVFGHFHTHREAEVGETVFRCVGSIDGSDGRNAPLGYILNPGNWTWETVELSVLKPTQGLKP